MNANKLVIGTRGSQLALWQAHHVADRLRETHPGIEVEINIIKTTGDRIQNVRLSEVGGKGLFVKEIEEALFDGSADIAVHSMKDVPAELPTGLELYGMVARASAMDALCSRHGATLNDLPTGCVVGTSSLRRQFQLLTIRPDIKVVSVRGNVETRLRKLADGFDNIEATILAVAGLSRLGLADNITEVLEPPGFLPAIGQGAVGIECRADDLRVQDLLDPLRHHATEVCVRAERGVLLRLEGDCHLPIACYATLDGDAISLVVRLGSPDGTNVLEDSVVAATDDPRQLGFDLADRLLARGAKAVIDGAKNP